MTPVQLMVSFTVGDQEFGIDILQVQEIGHAAMLAPLTNAPDYVEGAMILRGRTVPVVNLRTRFGMPRKVWDENTRIIVVEFSRRQIGFIVDALQEIVRIPKLQAVGSSLLSFKRADDYLKGTGILKDRALHVMDLEKIFRHEAALLDQSA